MANAKVMAKKEATVASLTEKVKNAASMVLVDYQGISVAQDTALRAEMRKNGVDYAVVKNTLLRFALAANGYSELEPLLNGTTSAAFSDDSITPSRILDQFSTKMRDKFNVKGGFIEGRIMGVADLKSIAQIPSKEALIAQVLGTMLAPISSLAFVLAQVAEKGGAVVGTVEAAPVVEEAAPVEEEATPVIEEAAPVVEDAAPVEEAPAAEEAPASDAE